MRSCNCVSIRSEDCVQSWTKEATIAFKHAIYSHPYNKNTRNMFFDHNSIDIDEFCALRARTDVVRWLQSQAAVLPFRTFLRRDAFSSRYRGEITKCRKITHSKYVYYITRHVYRVSLLSALCYLSSISACKAHSPKESEARLNLTPSRQIF